MAVSGWRLPCGRRRLGRFDRRFLTRRHRPPLADDSAAVDASHAQTGARPTSLTRPRSPLPGDSRDRKCFALDVGETRALELARARLRLARYSNPAAKLENAFEAVWVVGRTDSERFRATVQFPPKIVRASLTAACNAAFSLASCSSTMEANRLAAAAAVEAALVVAASVAESVAVVAVAEALVASECTAGGANQTVTTESAHPGRARLAGRRPACTASRSEESALVPFDQLLSRKRSLLLSSRIEIQPLDVRRHRRALAAVPVAAAAPERVSAARHLKRWHLKRRLLLRRLLRRSRRQDVSDVGEVRHERLLLFESRRIAMSSAALAAAPSR